MVEEAKRTLAYFCPSCRQSVVAERSVFALAAGPTSIPCPCGKSALKVELPGDQVKLTVPCLLCNEEHSVSCSTHAFLHQTALAFACGNSGMDCCYVGEEGTVFAAMSRLEETIDKLERATGAEGTFLDDIIMEEVLSELKDIAQREGISCQCGAKGCQLQINFSSVDLSCGQCGATLRIPAATEEDLEHLCCQHTLTLHRAEKEG